ncbi:MAG: tRNA (adenosine(37)-N6)-threonylcarbamoyltransferase complex dimerization subunit type 1 TsaB, partial [Aeromonas veronii]
MNELKILAVDTATEACSAALLVGDKLFSRWEEAPRDHTRKILPMVQAVLEDAGISLSDLDAIAFGRGPGSFTGVRIGISVAQGLAFGAGVPLIGISTLAAMAQGAYRLDGAEQVLTAIDARMNEVYFGRYELIDGRMQLVGDEVVSDPAALV